MVATSRRVGGWLDNIELEDLPDESYFLKMRACSLRVREWDDRYIGLLAGAALRQLPGQCGFRDIFHMAGVQARMSRKKVTEVLRISRAIQGCAGLWRLFTRAEVAWTKIRAVALLARPERDEELCWRVKSHTRRAIELWVRQSAREAAAGRGPSTPRSVWHDSPGGGKPQTSVPGSTQLGQGALTPLGAVATGGASDAPPSAYAAPITPAGSTESGSLFAPATTEALTREDGARSPQMSTSHEVPAPSGARPKDLASVNPSGPVAAGPPGARPHIAAGQERPAAALDPSALAADLTQGRVASSDKVMWMLAAMGVDPLSIEKLRRDHEALPAKHGQRSLVWVLEQAIRAYRPSGRSIKLTGLLVHSRCADCARGTVDGVSGPLPVDDADGDVIRHSRVTVDLDRELAASGVPIPPGAVPREGPPSNCVQTTAPTPGNTPAGPVLPGHDRPPVPARYVRFLVALQQGRCAATGCRRVVAELHHRVPFDPAHGHQLAQMHLICRDHHHLVHTDGFENPEEPPWMWRARSSKPPVTQAPNRRRAVDQAYQERIQAPVRQDEALARTLASQDP